MGPGGASGVGGAMGGGPVGAAGGAAGGPTGAIAGPAVTPAIAPHTPGLGVIESPHWTAASAAIRDIRRKHFGK